MYAQNGGDLCSQINGLVCNGMEYFGNKSEVEGRCSRDVEMLRLIGQYLCDKGLNSAYAQLSKESGVSLEHDDATELRHATLEGRWNDAEAAVDRLAPLIGDLDSADEIRFLLLEQRFLEHLEANEVMPAVTLLRNRITPMQRNTERVHTLASCLMCRTNVELRAQAGGWAGKDAGSRLQLINRIQAFVPPQTMLPPRRLEELIEDSVRAQLSTCIFHNPPLGVPTDFNSISLLQRHACGMQDFPAFCIQTLHQRDGELWLCQFSPDGSYLAVGGKDANVDVFRVDPVRHTISRFRVLTTPSYVGCLCWSPDSKKLAACCGEEQGSVLVFDVLSGQQLCNQKVHDEDTYSSATFFADSRKLAFGGLKGIFYVMDTEDQGRILTSVEGYRVQGMAAILPPMPHVGLDVNLDGNKLNSGLDISAPGAPDSILGGSVPMDSTLCPFPNAINGQVDQLLIADSLHRIRLFRFGMIGPATNSAGPTLPPGVPSESGDPSTPSSDSPPTAASTAPPAATTATAVSTATSTTEEEHTQLSSPTDLSVYLASSGAPGAPGTGSVIVSTDSSSVVPISSVVSTASDNPSIAAALTVARLSRQQQRLLQSSLNSGATSTGQLFWNPQSPYQSSRSIPHGLNTQTSSVSSYSPASSTLPPGILFDMPILPVSLARLGPSSAQGLQQPPQPSSLRPVLHHSGSTLSGTPYTVVSSSSGGNLGSGGSSLTILFGTPLERSASSTYPGPTSTTTATTSAEVRALTAAAAAAALAGSHSQSFAGLVHSLTSMVAATSSLDTGSSTSGAGRAVTATTDASVGPVVSTSTSTVAALSSAANLASTTGSSSVTSTTGFTPSSAQPAAQLTNGSNYGLLDHRTLFKETHAVQSITMSRSGQRALITIHKMGLHLWDVESCAIVQRFIGYKQDTFRLHSTFGGANENFVATGSETQPTATEFGHGIVLGID
ncbi:hypothetical protein CRM22_000347 [Opisthorchis felineus]|uniref:CTLH domain-containing protein n=1 Tax=Opisthorchis felineus TaxID=147828 RepID=A0A4S2MFD3_OPIFE|nr:hypothetical protein CRM22_000347 [Opisthorchis felineus]